MTTEIGLSAEKVTNLYLWGTETRPENEDLLSSGIIRPTDDPRVPTSVNVDDYMSVGPGRYATAHDFGIVHSFFASDASALRTYANVASDEDATFTEEEFRNYIGGADALISQSESLLDHAEADFAERIYIWETVAFEIADTARFAVTPEGKLEIRSFAVIPFNTNGHDDFDFKGGWTSQVGNPLLEFAVDPSGIGRTVDLFFTGTPTTTTFGESDYWQVISLTTRISPT